MAALRSPLSIFALKDNKNRLACPEIDQIRNEIFDLPQWITNLQIDHIRAGGRAGAWSSIDFGSGLVVNLPEPNAPGGCPLDDPWLSYPLLVRSPACFNASFALCLSTGPRSSVMARRVVSILARGGGSS